MDSPRLAIFVFFPPVKETSCRFINLHIDSDWPQVSYFFSLRREETQNGGF